MTPHCRANRQPCLFGKFVRVEGIVWRTNASLIEFVRPISPLLDWIRPRITVITDWLIRLTTEPNMALDGITSR